MNHEEWVNALKEHEFDTHAFDIGITKDTMDRIKEAGMHIKYTEGSAFEVHKAVHDIMVQIQANNQLGDVSNGHHWKSKVNNKEIELLQHMLTAKWELYYLIPEIECDGCDGKYECNEECGCDNCNEMHAQAHADAYYDTYD